MGKAIIIVLCAVFLSLLTLSYLDTSSLVWGQADEVDQRSRGNRTILEYTISAATDATQTVAIPIYYNSIVAMMINTATLVSGPITTATDDGHFWLEGTPNAARIPYATLARDLLAGGGTIDSNTTTIDDFGLFYYDVRGMESVRAGYAGGYDSQSAVGGGDGYATKSITIIRY